MRLSEIGDHRLALALAVAGLMTSLQPVSAQNTGQVGGASGPVVIDGSPPPVAPASITRDEAGRATVRAIGLSEPLTLDGQLDEDVYSRFRPFGDFVQVTPVAGDPSSERTDVWASSGMPTIRNAEVYADMSAVRVKVEMTRPTDRYNPRLAFAGIETWVRT